MSDTTNSGGQPPGSQDSKVGYRKPPKRTRFQAGQSGNPRGRPKGVRNFSTEVRQVSQMPVVVVEGGKKKRISTQHGMLLKLRESALTGDQRALDRLLKLSAEYNDAPAPLTDAMPQEDQAILVEYEARVIARHEAAQLAASVVVSRHGEPENEALTPEASEPPHNDGMQGEQS